MHSTLNTLSFKDNTYLREYVSLLIQLHELIQHGDEEEADRIRELMDAPSLHLTGGEVQWVNGLSADLYSLSGEEILESNPYSTPDYRTRIAEAWRKVEDEPNRVLELLRLKQDVVPPANAAYARGRAYRLLGFLDLETAFMRLASELKPQEFFFKMALFSSLNNQQRFSELNQELEAVFADPTSAPELVILAVSLSVIRIRRADDNATRRDLGIMRKRLKQVFKEKPPEGFEVGAAVTGLHTLGEIEDKLNRSKAAQEIYRQALGFDPQNQALRVSLAMSLKSKHEDQAFEIFKQVASEGTVFEIAYLFAAKFSGERGLFEDSIAFIEKAIAITTDSLLLAYCYEILAISEARLNGATDRARKAFREALRLAPDDANIQTNNRTFEEEASKDDSRIMVGKRMVKVSDISQWIPQYPQPLNAANSISEIGQEGVKAFLQAEASRVNNTATGVFSHAA